MDSYPKELEARIEKSQKELTGLSDDELMRIHEGLYSKPHEKIDAAYMAAVSREVDKRSFSASWIWRRKLKPGDYKKWINHKNKIETMAANQIISDFSKYNYPQSQELVKRMSEYLKQFEK